MYALVLNFGVRLCLYEMACLRNFLYIRLELARIALVSILTTHLSLSVRQKPEPHHASCVAIQLNSSFVQLEFSYNTRDSIKHSWISERTAFANPSMKRNENLVLVGSKVALVPYKREHVLKYHEWMQSPFLQEMTASEPLTLEEEYEMQQSWHKDENKCTFIIIAKNASDQSQSVDEIKTSSMIGDVNIFLNDPDNDPTFGEIEIMIAEEKYRRTGCGLEALKIMMRYALMELKIQTFHAKISLNNQPSIDLFQKKLGFYPVSKSEVFQEITLEWSIHTPSEFDKLKDPEDVYGSKATEAQRKANIEFGNSLHNMTVKALDWE